MRGSLGREETVGRRSLHPANKKDCHLPRLTRCVIERDQTVISRGGMTPPITRRIQAWKSTASSSLPTSTSTTSPACSVGPTRSASSLASWRATTLIPSSRRARNAGSSPETQVCVTSWPKAQSISRVRCNMIRACPSIRARRRA